MDARLARCLAKSTLRPDVNRPVNYEFGATGTAIPPFDSLAHVAWFEHAIDLHVDANYTIVDPEAREYAARELWECLGRSVPTYHSPAFIDTGDEGAALLASAHCLPTRTLPGCFECFEVLADMAEMRQLLIEGTLEHVASTDPLAIDEAKALLAAHDAALAPAPTSYEASHLNPDAEVRVTRTTGHVLLMAAASLIGIVAFAAANPVFAPLASTLNFTDVLATRPDLYTTSTTTGERYDGPAPKGLDFFETDAMFYSSDSAWERIDSSDPTEFDIDDDRNPSDRHRFDNHYYRITGEFDDAVERAYDDKLLNGDFNQPEYDWVSEQAFDNAFSGREVRMSTKRRPAAAARTEAMARAYAARIAARKAACTA